MEEITHHRRQCVASNRAGERCKRAPIPGGTVCILHGGGVSHVKEAAHRRLLAMIEPLTDIIDEHVERFNGSRCPTCGGPTGDIAPIIKMWQLVMDRIGLGPQATLSLQRDTNTQLEDASLDDLLAKLHELKTQEDALNARFAAQRDAEIAAVHESTLQIPLANDNPDNWTDQQPVDGQIVTENTIEQTDNTGEGNT